MKVQAITTGILAVLLAGCQEVSTETPAVAEARADAVENTREARLDANAEIANASERVADAERVYARSDTAAENALTRAESEAMIKTAHANFDVARTEADGQHDVAQERCDALAGVAKDACNSTADEILAANRVDAIAIRDAALVSAEFHE